MKWVSHKFATAAIVFSVTGNIIVAGVAMLGSVFPDSVEGKIPPQTNKVAYKKWRSRHRKHSHWLIPYLLLWYILYRYCYSHEIVTLSIETVSTLLEKETVTSIIIVVANLANYFVLGAILHILQDAICGKVPVFTPKNLLGVRLFRVGSMMEYVIVFPGSVGLIIWRILADSKIIHTLTIPELPSFFF